MLVISNLVNIITSVVIMQYIFSIILWHFSGLCDYDIIMENIILESGKPEFWEQEKSRLEDKLMNKIFKCLIRFLIEVIVMTVLIVGINIFMNGMYLWGLPRINDIQSVNITYPSVTDDVKEISSREDIELALKLTGFLKYDLFGEVNSEEEPAITITYFLKDGTSKTISANNTTVWWNNKIHVIKDKEMFVNLTEGIFFLEDLQTK